MTYAYPTLPTRRALQLPIFLLGMVLGVWGLSRPAQAQIQSFSTAPGLVSLPDRASVEVPIPVQMSQPTLSMQYGLLSVCLDIQHTYIGDLRITILSPQGLELRLWAQHGGSGRDMSNTCFTANAPRLASSATMAQAPFSGLWRPAENFNGFNQSLIDPSGIWKVWIQDLAMGDSGRFVSATLRFGPNPPATPVSQDPCRMSSPWGCRCPDPRADTCWLMPDMTASADILGQDRAETAYEIRIGNATPNIGYGPLEVEGTGECYCDTVRVSCQLTQCPGGGAPRERLKQRLYQRQGRTMVSRYVPIASTMTHHPTHSHLHVDRWSQLTLRDTGTGRDARRWPIRAAGAKLSFCLINLAECRTRPGYCRDMNGMTIPNDSIHNYGLGAVTGCGRQQGIYAGHLDIYSRNLEGQAVNTYGVCPGRVWVVSETDPDSLFIDASRDNNWAATPITITRPAPAPMRVNVQRVGGTFTLSEQSTQSIRRPPLTWTLGTGTGQIIIEDTGRVQVTPTTPGVYTYTVQPRHGCPTMAPWPAHTGQLIITRTAGGALETTDLALKLVPNPARGQVTLTYGALPTRIGATPYTLIDALGRVQRRGALPPVKESAGRGQVVMSLQGLTPGLYRVQVSLPSGVITLPLAVD